GIREPDAGLRHHRFDGLHAGRHGSDGAEADCGGPVMLAVKDIGISFGALKAIDGVSFSANEGQILTVIGPNGAGKTTLFNVISGIYFASQGCVELGGEDVTSLDPDALAARGMSRTFQNLQIFQRMTVAQNVM